VRSARALLAPRGTLLTTDVSSAHSLVAAALLPFSQRRPPLGEAVLRREFCGSFGRVEIVASPAHAFDEPEIQLRAHAA